ncbi:hypothetical protein PEDI_45120 [Persicobacter diffluens]|uniref:Uncharacterized protein n=1 Tax=Persicobacter diffluens TaxID=981 RepID=A0AAN4W3N9_9BACT|nr:hypothetical protein PEDI_45120 [Persicobacter diffluens]
MKNLLVSSVFPGNSGRRRCLAHPNLGYLEIVKLSKLAFFEGFGRFHECNIE